MVMIAYRNIQSMIFPLKAIYENGVSEPGSCRFVRERQNCIRGCKHFFTAFFHLHIRDRIRDFITYTPEIKYAMCNIENPSRFEYHIYPKS